MVEVAKLSVALEADTSKLEAGLKKAESQVHGFGGVLQGAASVGFTALAAGAVGVVAGLGAATKSAADFQSQISGIAAVGGKEAVDRMSEISAKALQVGKDTSFSATEAAAGMEELIKAGVSIENVLGPATDAMTSLAAATGVGLADAAGIAANAMNQFHLEGQAVTEVADIIAGAANASAIDVKQFGLSLQSVGAVANLVGLSFKDTAVAIAEMGQAGIPASDAGTSLKTMLMSLQPSTAKASAEFQKLGIVARNDAAVMQEAALRGLDLSGSMDDISQRLYSSVTGWKVGTKVTDAQGKAWAAAQDELGLLSNAFFTAEGNAKPLAEIQGVLAESMKGLTKQQQLASLEIMFGSDAIRAAAVLADNGAEGFTKMADAMGKVSAADVAKTRLDNVNGSLEALKGSLEVAAITIGTALLPSLKLLVDGAVGVLNANMPLIEQFAADLPGAMAAAGGFMTGTLMPALGGLTVALGPPIRSVITWLTDTGWPGLVSAGAAVQGAVAEITRVLSALLVEMDKRGVFTDLNHIWTDLTAIAGSLGQMIAGLAPPIRDADEASAHMNATTGLTAGVFKEATGNVAAFVSGVRSIVDAASAAGKFLDDLQAKIIAAGLAINKFLREHGVPMWNGLLGGGGGPTMQQTAFRPGGGGGFAGGLQGVVPGGSGTTTSAGTHGGHPAIDIFAPKGTPINAPTGGISTPAYYSLGGNATIIAGDDGKFYYFAHGNVPFTAGRITAGQQIGQVGDTGNARGTSPHLHAAAATSASLFDAWNGSGDLDPVEVFNQVLARAGGMGAIVDAGGGLAQSLAQGISQGDAVVANAVETIVNEAIKQGMDPLIPLALAKAESSLNPKAPGGGLFQLTSTGQGAGMSQAQIQDPGINAAKFLSSHKELYAQLVAEGHVGEDLAATFGRIAEGSDPQYAYRYADAYRALVAQFGTTRTSALTTGAATTTLGQDLQYNAQWVAQMADEQGRLATVMQGQVDPAAIQTSTAMRNMTAVLGPIERQVAGGAISFDTLQFKMVDLARATGVATKPWDQYSAGLITVNQAMANVINQSADAGPEFEALRQKMVANGGVAEQMALDYLQLVLNYGKVAPAAAVATTATTTATTATTSLGGAVNTVNNTIDPAVYTNTASAVDTMTGALGKGAGAFGEIGSAASGAQGQIDSFHSAAESLASFLDEHTFHVKVEVDPIPSEFMPGSPTPFEMGLRGIADAENDLNRLSMRGFRALEMPSPKAAVRAIAEGGGGSSSGTATVNNIEISIPGFIGTRDELVDALHDGLLRKKRRNGRLALGDRD